MEKSRLRRENSMAVQNLDKMVEEELRAAKEAICAAKILSILNNHKKSYGLKPIEDACSSKISEEMTNKEEVTLNASGKASTT